MPSGPTFLQWSPVYRDLHAFLRAPGRDRAPSSRCTTGWPDRRGHHQHLRRQAATLTLGTGELSPAVEQRLLGLEEGTRAQFEIPAGEAFGDRNPEMVQWVARKLLAQMGDPDEKYAVGDVVQFPTPDGMGSTPARCSSWAKTGRRRQARRRAVRLQPSARGPSGDLRSATDRSALMGPEEILLAEPRGFCAGVDRAIDIVERALAKFGRRSTCATRSCTTPSSSTTSRPRARSSSRTWPTCRPAPRWCSPRTA
jgi:hypothetical protein